MGLGLATALLGTTTASAELPPVPPFPEVPAPNAVDTVPMGDSSQAVEYRLDVPVTDGPFEPTWESIEKHYPGTPDWLREAKFGIWVHFGPQAAGKSGDWYARALYHQGSKANKNHLANYGHPSEVGYKEVLRGWNPDKLDPAKLVQIYKDAGARYLIIQAVHHDNYDLWDSAYQPWNSKRLGPTRDLLAEWSKAAKEAKIRFGFTFHHEYTWWWWQTAFTADKEGEKAGVPYDGRLTLADGKGKWWEGLDPRLLYGADLREYKTVEKNAFSPWHPPVAGIFFRHEAYAKWYVTQWALRMIDAVHKYDPDFIYTDGTGQQPFSGSHTGTGFKADAMQRVIADFYNYTLKQRGKVDVFSIVKFRKKTNGTVNTEEGGIPPGIKTDQAWIAETPVGDWYYGPGFTYDSGMVIRYLLEEVSRDGNVGLCVSPLPDGSLDEGALKMLDETGAWLKINGEGIYGSHAWVRFGEGLNGKLNVLPGGKLHEKQARHQFSVHDLRFTVGKEGWLYAWCMTVPGPKTELRIASLGSDSPDAVKVETVGLLGHRGHLEWKQENDALVIRCPDAMPFATAVGFKIGHTNRRPVATPAEP